VTQAMKKLRAESKKEKGPGTREKSTKGKQAEGSSSYFDD